MKQSDYFNGKAEFDFAKTFKSVILAGALSVATEGNGHQAHP